MTVPGTKLPAFLGDAHICRQCSQGAWTLQLKDLKGPRCAEFSCPHFLTGGFHFY